MNNRSLETTLTSCRHCHWRATYHDRDPWKNTTTPVYICMHADVTSISNHCTFRTPRQSEYNHEE